VTAGSPGCTGPAQHLKRVRLGRQARRHGDSLTLQHVDQLRGDPRGWVAGEDAAHRAVKVEQDGVYLGEEDGVYLGEQSSEVGAHPSYR
jgi:hypothetical protein